jgi:hypothetical protein
MRKSRVLWAELLSVFLASVFVFSSQVSPAAFPSPPFDASETSQFIYPEMFTFPSRLS